MNDDLLPITGLDQSIQVNSETVMEKIDEILKRSVKEKNVEIALNLCEQLTAVSHISGKGLAKALYFMQKNWHKYGKDEAFEDVIFERIGKARHTIERLVKAEGIFDNALIPQEHVETFQNENLGIIFPIANTLYQGYEINEETWEKLAEAPNDTTVRKIIREDVKGVPPRKGSLQLYLDGEGSILAFQDDVRYFVGTLEIHTKEDAIQKAIERIKNRSGILEL